MICQKMEELLAPLGAHCGLTSSCLYKGASEKDIDIIIYSHQLATPYNKGMVLAHLSEWLLDQNCDLRYNKRTDTWTPSQSTFQTTRNKVDKDVVVAFVAGVRLDLFFMP